MATDQWKFSASQTFAGPAKPSSEFGCVAVMYLLIILYYERIKILAITRRLFWKFNLIYVQTQVKSYKNKT